MCLINVKIKCHNDHSKFAFGDRVLRTYNTRSLARYSCDKLQEVPDVWFEHLSQSDSPSLRTRWVHIRSDIMLAGIRRQFFLFLLLLCHKHT